MIEIIANPSAKNRKAAKCAEAVKKYYDEKGVEYRIHYTDAPRHATRLAEELSKTSDVIVALGGDGTVNEVFNGIDAEKVKFGIIPCGSGNDFADSAKIPLFPKKAAELILSGEAKPTDYMVCGGVRGLNIIGTGIDVDILKRCRKSKILKGKLQYVISLVISLIKFVFYKFYIMRDGAEKREEKEALIACVGNGKKFGGGIKMCPEAEIDDGKLDFVVAGKLKKSKIPHAFIQLMKGNILKQNFTSFERVEHIRLEFDKPVTIQIDGELYDDIDFDLSIVKSGVKIFRPYFLTKMIPAALRNTMSRFCIYFLHEISKNARRGKRLYLRFRRRKSGRGLLVSRKKTVRQAIRRRRGRNYRGIPRRNEKMRLFHAHFQCGRL